MIVKHTIYYIDHVKDFQMTEVRACDCFIESVINFLKTN